MVQKTRKLNRISLLLQVTNPRGRSIFVGLPKRLTAPLYVLMKVVASSSGQKVLKIYILKLNTMAAPRLIERD